MTDDNLDRLNRLAERAKKLDDVIRKAATMQKRIVEEIRRMGERDKLKPQPTTATPTSRKKGTKRKNAKRSRRDG